MKAFLSLCLSAFAFIPSAARADDATAHHRAVYAAITKQEKSFKKVTATHKDAELVFELQGWMDGQTLCKIVATVPGEDGDGSDEYYLENGKPLFVFRHYSTPNPEAGKKALQVEDRFYFKDGKLFQWLGNNKKPVATDSPDFAVEAERLTSNLPLFITAFNDRAASKDKASQATEGTFLGIEQGDYAHWNMRTHDGKELSFFVLNGDASVDKVCDKPEDFIGKKCRIQWKQSMETIPEAGGKMKLEQVFSVEWLGKK